MIENYDLKLPPAIFAVVWASLGEQKAKDVFPTMTLIQEQARAQELLAQMKGAESGTDRQE